MIRRIVGLGLMLGAMLLLLAQLVRLAATGPAVAVAGPAAPASGPAAPASGPDLSVTLEVLDAQPLGIGAPLRLRLVVANGGTAVITQSFITRVYLNPSVVMSGSVTGAAFDSATLPGLGAGAQEVLTLTTHFIAGVGDHALVAMVDAQQVITEADELNNVSASAALRIDNDAALQRMDVPGLATNRHTNGVLNVQTLGIFGPDSCTTFGDAFSPLASPFAPGVYSYTYRIRIPADYAHDVVRVELFDPDSMNAATNTATVIHTNLAVSLGDPPSENLSCSGNVSQVQPCLINTGELNLAGVTLDTINPYWFMRIDENRTGGVNNSGCGAPATYTPADNTQTRFALYYLADGAGGPQPVPLAAYTGQVADGVRDSGAHQTDLRWVAPGAPLSYDQPAGVPTECGSPNGGDFDPVTCPGGTPARTGSGFEVSLSQAAPDIVTDLATGDRYLYLDVTALSGASENVFNVWAGPPIYVNSISSDVNVRNLQILNNPGAHDAGGLAVFGVDYLAVNNLHAARMAYPLLTLGPEFAGETLEISLFDSDAGAQPPITFYFDTIASSDYSISFTNEGGRCAPGSCNNLWVTPP
ncbi:MAG: hypothetical protein KC425_02485, partial [Anaerolineales bacterium]|nr:hypothetical protein [Anaerolineales bacterium]